ncbi:MAG: hypothetical protein GX804_07015 [Lentisphaerae bacterium]|jgi:uncharacterized repeat protein (TIGR04138 family)|nr:hypothetical protein [Lentisphaerota bacterium]
MNEQSFEETVARLYEENSSYDIEAYYFIREALDYATRKIRTGSDNRHVTGAELSEMAREYALEQFGPLALLVLNEWGLYETSDFGEIVMSLVNEGIFSKTGSDKKEDFDDVYDFETAFAVPFLPEANDSAKNK